MITKFTVANFKKLTQVEIELGDSVVFIGPNNSGKTSALQALALWNVGWRRWAEKRDHSSASQRTGVTINRKSLTAVPVPSAKLLWRDLNTQQTLRENGKHRTDKTYITLTAEGVHLDQSWKCGLEFYYANEESLYCRLIEPTDGSVPDAVRRHNVVFLPPMSGLTEREYRKEAGEINVLIGEGRTAEVLRNLCWQLHSDADPKKWNDLAETLEEMFLIDLKPPKYIQERSEITLTYCEKSGLELDISSSGRGCQQVMLLLAYILANPGVVLLLDEPDAHLEILRQRDVYNLITNFASRTGSQVISASHSEVVLQEAAERDVVIAFVGSPHRMDTRSRQQVKKALESIRMSDCFLAEQCGWMLYLEGATDLEILKRLAVRLQHPASEFLSSRVPVVYLGNNKPQEARDHYYGLREAKNDLRGFALFDRLDRELHFDAPLVERMWQQREIENYLVSRESLEAFVQSDLNKTDLFEKAEAENRIKMLDQCIVELEQALSIMGKPDPWGTEIKVTDDFLDPLFRRYYERLGVPQKTFKRDYHLLADVIAIEAVAQEVSTVLDSLYDVARQGAPSGG